MTASLVLAALVVGYITRTFVEAHERDKDRKFARTHPVTRPIANWPRGWSESTVDEMLCQDGYRAERDAS